MKYPKSWYIDSGIFEPDMDGNMEHRHEKLVKTRKVHKCAYCKKDIPKGELAVNESAIFPHEGGWKSCYICQKCIAEWLDETRGKLCKCPFCGADAELVSDENKSFYSIRCSQCRAKMFIDINEPEEESIELLIENWNRRI